MSFKIKLVIAVILISIISSGYFYILALQGKLEAAAEVQQRMESVIDQQKIAMERQNQDMRLMQDVNKDI
jgi:predicted Holliday junction resolvase-like endonuclease